MERMAEVKRLRTLGLTQRLTAKEMGLAQSTVRNLLYDPDGTKQKARRERYRKSCPLCGKKMDGSGGYKTQRRYCSDCARELQKRPIRHGTHTGYARGCRCRSCRDANGNRMRDYYKRNGPSPSRRNKLPEVARAHHLVNQAIKTGSIIVPVRCSKCGAIERGRKGKHIGGRWLHAHHVDYSQPLEVIFVCPPCHKAIHADAKEQPRRGGVVPSSR